MNTIPAEPLTRQTLDALALEGSECPRCTQHHASAFHPPTPCHPKLNYACVSYAHGSGLLEVKCFICGTKVFDVKVSDGGLETATRSISFDPDVFAMIEKHRGKTNRSMFVRDVLTKHFTNDEP